MNEFSQFQAFVCSNFEKILAKFLHLKPQAQITCKYHNSHKVLLFQYPYIIHKA
jgi:hypothetical protein